jgi:high affinity Mn2+ porin
MALAAAAPIPADAEQAPLNLSIPQTAPYAGQSEDWSIHVQYTLIGEGHRSPYQGTNSLPEGGELRETVRGTTYLGRRLWNGGELYFNPEFNQGFGLAHTLGLGGFPNGEERFRIV